MVLAAGVLAGGLLRVEIDTQLDTLLPADERTSAFLDKADRFGADPIVILLESKEPRLALLDQEQFRKQFELEGRISRLDGVASVYGPATVLNQIAASAQQLLAVISGRRDGIRLTAEAEARARGVSSRAVRAAGDRAVRKFEVRYGKLLVEGMDIGLPTLKNPRFIQSVIFDESGEPQARWRFVVPRTDAIAVLVRPEPDLDQQETSALVDDLRGLAAEVGPDTDRTTVSGVPVVTAGLADQVERETPLLAGLAGLLLLLRFALVPDGGSLLRRVMPLLAALVGAGGALAAFGWAGVPLSIGAAVLLPLLLSLGSSFPLYMRQLGDRRVVYVAAGASAAAFGALWFSPLPFVRQLGLALALGVVLTVMTGRILVRRPVPAEGSPAPRGVVASGSTWDVRRVSALMVVALVGVVGWAMLSRADVTADPLSLASGSEVLEDATYVERVLRSSGEVSVILSGEEVLTPEAVAWGQAAEEAIITRHGDQMRRIITLPDLLSFLGDEPTAAQVESGFALIPPYVTRAVVDGERSSYLMTYGVTLADLDSQQELFDDVRADLPPPPDGFSVGVVGLPVAAAGAFDRVSEERYLANGAAIIAAGLVLLVGLRARRDAGWAVLAAVAATGGVVGLMVALGVPLSPLSVAVGSLTTVTATEFYVLLEGHRSRRVVAWACATSAAGYLVLAASSLVLLREFGLVMAVSVALSYVSARVLRWVRDTAPPKDVVSVNPSPAKRAHA